jgi:hypothetical protein
MKRFDHLAKLYISDSSDEEIKSINKQKKFSRKYDRIFRFIPISENKEIKTDIEVPRVKMNRHERSNRFYTVGGKISTDTIR